MAFPTPGRRSGARAAPARVRRRALALGCALLAIPAPSLALALVDSDGDGLGDAWEIAHGFDPNAPGEQTLDPDLDGLDNLAEQAADTDPHLADSDADGLGDGDELGRVRLLGFGSRQVISSNANAALGVVAADLDGDGDLDVLSASFVDDKVAWYENRLDEPAEDLSLERVITTTANGARSVFATDLDGDGDPDVLVASQFDDKVAWYENRLDEPSADFGPEQILSTVDDGATFVFAADLDGDGDADVLSTAAYHRQVAWFENRLDEPSADFGPREIVTSLADLAFCVRTGDLDGDGDPDVISASPNDDKVAWYENRLDEPSADFGPQQVVSVVPDRPHAVFAADFDRDGDQDLLSASENDGRVAWYENRLDEPSADFGPPADLTLSAPGATAVFVADLDGDADPDALSASLLDDRITWFENRLDEPSADFREETVTAIADRASYVFAADLDGDGDRDLLSASEDDDTIAWYENPGTDPLDPDSDQDGLLDGYEVQYEFDPNRAGEQIEDPDGDGLDNLPEQAAGTNPRLADTDGDHRPDGLEIQQGTDPLDPGSFPRVVPVLPVWAGALLAAAFGASARRATSIRRRL
jgi:hypothetical protein